MLALPYKRYSYEFNGDFKVAGKSLYLTTPESHRVAEEACDGDTGISTWDAAILLAQFLESEPALVAAKNVVELGTGLGVCAISAGLLAAAHVTATDLDYILPTTRKNIKLNGLCERVVAKSLDWTKPEEASINWEGTDVVLASDTVWLEHLVDPFVDVLVFASQQNPSVKIILSNQMRSEGVWVKFLRLIEPHFTVLPTKRDGALDIIILNNRK